MKAFAIVLAALGVIIFVVCLIPNPDYDDQANGIMEYAGIFIGAAFEVLAAIVYILHRFL